MAQQALQKLIDNSLDKQNADEIDTVTGATDTSNTYKTIISSLLSSPVSYEVEDKTEKISLAEPDVQYTIERTVVNREGFKSGIGGYVMNSFQDADYNRNGNLFTNEYICAVILNENNRIEQVKFDHIGSNISFDRFGKVPTGGAKAYVFTSDKTKAALFIKWLPAGFRTLNPVKMLFSGFLYVIFFMAAMQLDVKNAPSGKEWIDKTFFLVFFLVAVAFIGNYMDIWHVFRADRIKQPILRIVWICFIAFIALLLTLAVMMIVEDAAGYASMKR